MLAQALETELGTGLRDDRCSAVRSERAWKPPLPSPAPLSPPTVRQACLHPVTLECLFRFWRRAISCGSGLGVLWGRIPTESHPQRQPQANSEGPPGMKNRRNLKGNLNELCQHEPNVSRGWERGGSSFSAHVAVCSRVEMSDGTWGGSCRDVMQMPSLRLNQDPGEAVAEESLCFSSRAPSIFYQ